MTPQERDLLTALLQRLERGKGAPRDPEADALIREAVARQPDAPYLLAQTVLIQDMALANAQKRINELQSQGTSGSFLGGAAPQAAAAPVWTRSGASMPNQPTPL
ncbi:MAG TPA: DUF2076 domain-containing protein, partial [Stellaceae bacterium]|nr:DUF2076 domain-containing protein [Stellaceae bacterium]